MPAVVAITSVSIQEIPSFFGSFGFGNYGVQEYSSTGSGSGIIVGENNDELLIATNNHVVEGATTLASALSAKTWSTQRKKPKILPRETETLM